MTNKRGFSISVEGVDGCGKDTAIAMLKSHLESEGHEVEVLADLYSTEVGIKVREIFITEAALPDDITTMLLITAARRELINTRILPALSAGKVVILNRFKDSTIAYQCFARAPNSAVKINVEENMALGPHMARTLESINVCGQVEYMPDHTLLITIDPEVQQLRMVFRGKLDRYDAAGTEWHQVVRNGFDWVVARDSEWSHPNRITIIDNSSNNLQLLYKSVYNYLIPILEKRK